MEDNFLHIFPKMYRDKWNSIAGQVSQIEEIRIRLGKPILVYTAEGEWYLSANGLTRKAENVYVAEEQELNRYLNHFCQDSIYAFQEEIKQGYITIAGGHRVGLAGQVVLDKGRVVGMKNITFLNIRMSHQIRGVADAVIPYLYENKKVLNTLIIAPPGCGKTTLLRDVIRNISDGNMYGEGTNVSVIDERSEIAGSYEGRPQNDLGVRTDVLDGCPKEAGLLMLLRAMAPKVIAVDELGGKEEEEALFKLAHCGVRILATVHGDGLDDVAGRMSFERMIEEKLFERYIVLGRLLGKPAVLEIYGKNGQRLYRCLK